MAINKSNAKTYFIVISIAIGLILIYVYRDKIFGSAEVKQPTGPAPIGTSGWASDSSFPIKKGSWGQKVKALQKVLGVGTDGKFGPITEGALKKKTGKTEISSQAEYDAIVPPSSVSTPPGTPPGTPPVIPGVKTIDDYIGTSINSGSLDGVSVKYIWDDTEFKKYGENQYIGRLGESKGNGYHHIFDVAGDNSTWGVKISDEWLKRILNIQ